MRLTLLIFGALLLGLLAFWLLRDSSTRSEPSVALGESPVEDSGAPELAPLQNPPAQAPTRASERARVDSEPAPAGEVSAALQAGGRRVRVLLLDSSTELPLAGISLALNLRFSRSRERVLGITDAAGEFEVRVDPGEFLVLQEPGGADVLTHEIQPQVFEVPAGDDAEPFGITLHAVAPPQVLEVQVVNPDGSPAAGAWALFSSITEAQPFVDPRGRTDGEGRVSLGVWDPTEFTDGILRAWDDAGQVSAYLPVEAPFVPGLRRLVLGESARVEVVVRDADDQPIAERRVLSASLLPAGLRLYGETNEAGRHTFGGLFPGEYDIGAWHATSRYEYERAVLGAGESRTLEFTLEEAERLAALRGRVVDEEGQPLADVALIVTPEGGWPDDVRTDDQGEFVFHGRECSSLLVQANVWAEGDAFEPDSIRASYGAQDLLFTRTTAADLASFEVEVVDALTGEEVEHFVATIDRGPGSEEWSSSYAPRRAFELRVLPQTRWRIASSGYVVRQLNLSRALAELEPDQRLRIALEAGLDHSFVVRDADTLEPLPGVVLTSESAGTIRSDGAGRVHVRAPEWSTYGFSHPGYEPGEWNPDDYVLWDWGPLLLERLEADGER